MLVAQNFAFYGNGVLCFSAKQANFGFFYPMFVTLHMQHERGKVVGVGSLIYVCVCLWTIKFDLYFSDRLTFSNIRGRTSRLIYRLALSLHAPETLSSSSKSRISYIMCTLFSLSEG